MSVVIFHPNPSRLRKEAASLSIQRVRSKLAKTEVLLHDYRLREHIPETEPLSYDAMAAMLEQYSMVYVKPDLGTFGNGVMRVEAIPDGYRVQLGTRLHTYASPEELYEGILQLKSKGPYVIQRGIELLRHKDRRFDVRVMVQHNPEGRWETTGIIGRLSHPKRIVTNYHSGGTPLDLATLASEHLDAGELREYRKRLAVLGTSVARQLTTKYPRLKEIGIDVALDTSLHPWILEVNTLPDPFIFKRLKVKSIFRRIYRYAKAYGRFNAAKRSRRTAARRITAGKTRGSNRKTARHPSR
jgi:glutathione synthase/RimK-type ligase-like ATP-grasp enzyme